MTHSPTSLTEIVHSLEKGWSPLELAPSHALGATVLSEPSVRMGESGILIHLGGGAGSIDRARGRAILQYPTETVSGSSLLKFSLQISSYIHEMPYVQAYSL